MGLSSPSQKISKNLVSIITFFEIKITVVIKVYLPSSVVKIKESAFPTKRLQKSKCLSFFMNNKN